jgi:hypothetical protein
MSTAVEMKSKLSIEADQATATGGAGADVAIAGRQQDSHVPVVGKITQSFESR